MGPGQLAGRGRVSGTMSRMDPWKRFRLLACLAVILTVLGAGVVGWFVPRTVIYPYPYGWSWERSGWRTYGVARSLDPFVELRRDADEAEWESFVRQATEARATIEANRSP